MFVRTANPKGKLRYILYKNIIFKTRQETCELINTQFSADATFCTV